MLQVAAKKIIIYDDEHRNVESHFKMKSVWPNREPPLLCYSKAIKVLPQPYIYFYSIA